MGVYKEAALTVAMTVGYIPADDMAAVLFVVLMFVATVLLAMLFWLGSLVVFGPGRPVGLMISRHPAMTWEPINRRRKQQRKR